ncbi:MAG: branched-chain amino acid ABC transporter permease, partial [Leptothrix sp. (in: b-proteobacteria)]
PGGIASLIMMNLRVAAFGRLRPLLASYLALFGSGLAVLLGAGALIEMVYHLQLGEVTGSQLNYLGAMLDVKRVDCWFGAVFVMAVGGGLFELTRREFARQWGATQEAIEREIKRREAAA